MAIDVKICGVTTTPALEAAIGGGARYVGFVFYPPSPRHITIAEAEILRRRLNGSATSAVALVVDADDAVLAAITEQVAPDFLQMHGKETPDRVAEVKRRFGLSVIKALPVAEAEDVAAARAYEDVADLLLFDAKAPVVAGGKKPLPGGRGEAFDWRLLAAHAWRRPWLLSGGLNCDNLARAVSLTGAQAVDISSGVERTRGLKDPELITQFLHLAATLAPDRP